MKKLVTIKEFAKIAGVTHQAIYDLILKGELPSVTILDKRGINMETEAIKEFLKNRKK